MGESIWLTTLNLGEREELESARKRKEAGNNHYKSVYKRLKARGDARIRRANLKSAPTNRSKIKLDESQDGRFYKNDTSNKDGADE